MSGNTTGTLFKVTSFGESHGPGLGAVIDGCPPGIKISVDAIQADLDKRKPGQSKLTTTRKEGDIVHIDSGVLDGITTGTPIGLRVVNEDQRSRDYAGVEETYRPNHADYTYDKKYGFRDFRGGGRSSARVTWSTVAAGAIAKRVTPQVSYMAFVSSIYDIDAEIPDKVTHDAIESSRVRCPDPEASERMAKAISEAKKSGDSLGGIIDLVISGVTPGLGMPIYDKLSSEIGKSLLNINAVMGVERGSGFSATRMKGSEHNDIFVSNNGVIGTETNNSGGIQGGISNGEDITFRVAFKPTATLSREQRTVNQKGEEITMAIPGRHDPCVVVRAPVIVESAAALVIADHTLRQKAIA